MNTGRPCNGETVLTDASSLEEEALVVPSALGHLDSVVLEELRVDDVGTSKLGVGTLVIGFEEVFGDLVVGRLVGSAAALEAVKESGEEIHVLFLAVGSGNGDHGDDEE